MAYNYETNEIPTLFILRPSYDNAATEAAIVGAAGQFNYGKRMKNQSTPFDVAAAPDTKSFNVDMFDNVKTVTVGGTTLSYRTISAFVKKVGDTERALLS